MTKVFISIVAFVGALLTTSCTSNTYKIEGTTSGIPDGKVVYLSTWDMEPQQLDSTIVKDGKFEFTRTYGEIEENNALRLYCIGNEEEREWTSAILYGEPGATVKVHLDMKEYKNNTLSGSPLNDKEHAYNQESNKWSDLIIPLREKANDANLSEEERMKADHEADSLYGEMLKIEEKYLLDNADNVIGISMMATKSALFSNETKQKFMEMIPEKYKNHPAIIKEKEQIEVEAKTAEGQPMVDLEMENPEGKMVKLSDFVKENKVTVIDFWASWCGPCRKEIPNMKKIYGTFKNRGLGFVGVSFDTKKENWLKAIKEEQLPWPQMSDLKGWDCAASPAYNIHGIPFTLLVNQEGTIIGRNLHGDELIKRIEEYLSK